MEVGHPQATPDVRQWLPLSREWPGWHHIVSKHQPAVVCFQDYLKFWVRAKGLARIPGNLPRLLQSNPHLLRVSWVIGLGKEATFHLSICSYTCPGCGHICWYLPGQCAVCLLVVHYGTVTPLLVL